MKGKPYPNAKLTEADVRLIRQKWSYRGYYGASTKELARQYGVCKNAIFEIVNRITWPHVK